VHLPTPARCTSEAGSHRGGDAQTVDDLGAGTDTAARCLSAAITAAGGFSLRPFGCQLDEGSVHPCVVLSLDFGGLLYPMAVGGWFVMFTIPLIATTEGNCIAVTDGLSAERVSE